MTSVPPECRKCSSPDPALTANHHCDRVHSQCTATSIPTCCQPDKPHRTPKNPLRSQNFDLFPQHQPFPYPPNNAGTNSYMSVGKLERAPQCCLWQAAGQWGLRGSAVSPVHGDLRAGAALPRRAVHRPPRAARRGLQPAAQAAHQGGVHRASALLQAKR